MVLDACLASAVRQGTPIILNILTCLWQAGLRNILQGRFIVFGIKN